MHATCVQHACKGSAIHFTCKACMVMLRKCRSAKNFGPRNKFSGKISPGGPILPENFDPCPKI